ncbi:hypothetical protein K438DRAFT_1810766 [Mycena galopus ATCC 62051]|nr:hypothetical protein K438DRAFT_1810766 [Mycena galopus ATCC 62051]
MPGTRKSARKTSASIDIAKVAAADDLDSEEEMDIDPDVTLLGEGPDAEQASSEDEEVPRKAKRTKKEADYYVDSEEGDEPGSEDEEGARTRYRPGEEEYADFEGNDQSASEDEDEELAPPKKRKRSKSPEKNAKAPPRKIEYKIVVYTPEQMRKPKNSRGAPVTNVMKLLSDKPWIVLHTKILEAFDDALDSAPFDFSDYTITFTVPRQVTDPIRLNETKYKYLVEKALEIKTNPSARILVEPKMDMLNKENGKDDTSTTSKKGAKTKVPKARDILPGNVALNNKIGELRERWKCTVQGGACGSAHCFVSATDPDHFALSHAHIENWAAAMLKGKEFADIDTPPNNTLFDKVSAAARAARSPLLQQRRLELREQAAAAKNAVASPQFHFNIGPEALAFLRPAAPAIAIPDAFIPPPNTSNMLIPPPRLPGLDVSIEDFCSLYDLDDDICRRFKEHKFKHTDSFQFVEVSELTEMGFLRGEIAELKVAIKRWSRLPDAE